MLKFFGSSAKAPPQDDQHTHHEDLRSESSTPTPPGAQTPHPDLLDKRTPGLFSSYFGQVRSPSSTITPVASQSTTSTIPTMAQDQQKDASCQSPASCAREATRPKHLVQHGYPTPPVSLSTTPAPRPPCSSNAKEDSKKSRVSSKPLHTHAFLSSRRNSLVSDPLMGITNTQPVHALHLSKPGLHVSRSNTSSPITPSRSISKTPPPPPPPLEIPRSPTTSSVPQALTKNVPQATPPQTPRSTSSTTASRAHSPSIQTSPTRKDDNAKRRRKDSLRKAVTGEPKGRLSITISAGRGLRPSIDPYVVCSFQWNEYISKGPQGEGSTDDGQSTSPRRSVPIRRTASEMAGKPMAIPMRSRQSSHTSISSRDENPTKGQEVTDPVWNHEALL